MFKIFRSHKYKPDYIVDIVSNICKLEKRVRDLEEKVYGNQAKSDEADRKDDSGLDIKENKNKNSETLS